MTVLQVELAAESAVHHVLYDLITHDASEKWPRQGQNVTVLVGGAEVTVSVINTNGLVDVNRTDEGTLRRIVAAVLPTEDAAILAAGMTAARPFSDYSSLAAIEGMSSQEFEFLFPYITLFSGGALPTYPEAPSWVKKMLNLKENGKSVLSGKQATPGNIFRIEAVARMKNAASRRLSAEVLLTGRLDQPYWVYDWSWHLLDEKREEMPE